MSDFEKILDQALVQLKNGTPKAEIISSYPQHKTELLEFLEIAETFSTLPKKKVPKPAMQRKYLQVPLKTRAWFAWLHVSRLAGASIAIVLLLAAGTTAFYEAMQSLPGQTLFSIKKTAEQVQLHFASSDAQRAQLQLALARERLSEAQQILNSPSASANQQTAALNELALQTNAALQTAQTAASTDNGQSSPIATSLKDLSQQQQAVLSNIQSSKKGDAIAQLRQIAAATNEQANLIALNGDPGLTITAGKLTQINYNTLTVDGTSYNVASTTVFKDSTDTPVPANSLAIGSNVTVAADKNGNSSLLVAKEVLVMQDQTGSQTIATTTLTSQTATTTSSTVPSNKKIGQPQPQATTTEDDPSDNSSGQTIGTFIPEDPSPQFTP